MVKRTIRGELINRRDEEEVALYRFFDSEDRLLYVGIADEPMMRWREHAKRAEWWPDVIAYRVDWYASRDDAAAAERTSILSEKPLHNVVFNGIPYSDSRFPCMRLHALTWEHFREKPFTYHDLTDELGIPYGSAVTYGRQLVSDGAFTALGKRGKRLWFTATPPPEPEQPRPARRTAPGGR